MKERIHYNSEELIRTTESTLDELKMFQYEPRYRALLGETLLNKLAFWDRNIRAQKDNPFTLLVCGEFKRGKSSLINALLGEDVVTTNVTTETVTLNRICYGPHANEAILPGGRRMMLTDEEMCKDRLEELIRQSPEPITQLELHRPIELLRSMTIIDTPGLNDSLQDFSLLVERALQQADAVLYLCSVDSPLSQNEQLFLRTMVLPQKYTDLFIVANFADMLRKTDVERFQEFMDQRVATIISGQKVVLLSALDELCRTGGNERPNEELDNILADNFDAFRQKLTELIQTKRDTLIPDRIHRLTCGMKSALKSELDAIIAGLELDAQQAKARADAQQEQQIQRMKEQEYLQQKLRADIQDMQEEASTWVGKLMQRMSAELDQLADIPVEDFVKYYSTYCIDTIQEAVNRCVEYHMEQIYDQLDGISTETTRGMSRLEGIPSYGFRFVLDNKTWTMGDNVGYVASKVSQLGLLSMVVDGVAGAMRQKETANRTPQILQSIKKQYPVFCRSAMDTISDTYVKLAEKVHVQLADYFGSNLEEEKAQNEQIMRVARQTAESKGEIRAAVEQLKTALERLSIVA